MDRYGVIKPDGMQISPADEDEALQKDLHQLRYNGYVVLPEVLADSQLEECRQRLDRVYELQEREFGLDNLIAIHEEDLARSPLSYDPFFLAIALTKRVVALAHKVIGGGYVLLNLQNGILNRPNRKHHQATWHRDLPYQEFTSSKPLAISALFCIDEFTKENGCTNVLPYSHRHEYFPNDRNVAADELPVEASAGSVIVFDAMLFHRAGSNKSLQIRRGINHMYTIPIIKPQIELSALPHVQEWAAKDPWAAKILGVGQTVPASVKDFRELRLKRVTERPIKTAA